MIRTPSECLILSDLFGFCVRCVFALRSFHFISSMHFFFSAAEASQKNGTAIEEMDGCVRFTKRHSNTSGIRNFVLWRLEWARTLNYGRHTQR